MSLPVPEIAVPLGQGCHDLTTGQPYVPDAREVPQQDVPADPPVSAP